RTFLVPSCTWASSGRGSLSASTSRRSRPIRVNIDLCALLPHAAVRVYVMGNRAIRHEKATRTDIAQMRKIAGHAVKAGAIGFSISRTISHKSLTGEYTPTLRANEDKLAGIAIGLKDAKSGFIEFTSDWNEPDTKSGFDMLRRDATVVSGQVTYEANLGSDKLL